MLPTKEELRERYAAYSNSRLLDIVHNKDEYTSDALEVARAALAERNITAADVDHYLDEAEARRALAETLSRVQLSFLEKVLFFFAWFVIFGRAIRMNYAEDGLVMKLKQSRVFAIAGFASMILTGILTVLINFSPIGSFAAFAALFILFGRIEKRIEY